MARTIQTRFLRSDGGGGTDTAAGYYEGGLKDGLKHGKGKFTLPSWTYEGDFNDGAIHGKGKEAFDDGRTYEGDYKAHGIFHGKGKLTMRDGMTYEGDFKDGDICGKGKLTGMDGRYVYQGDFKDWQPTGTGMVIAGTADPLHIKNWRQIFPGVSGKKLKKKRRASKDETALIEQFQEMATVEE